MRFATYNVHACVGSDGRYAPDRTGEALLAVDADVLALQEVEDDSDFARSVLQRIAGDAGYHLVPGYTMLRGDVRYGNVLLTRHAPLSVRRHDLSVAGYEPRGAIDVTVQAGAHPVRVVATHLGLAARERKRQVRQLLGLGLAREPRCVLMGDFNEWLPMRAAVSALARDFARARAPASFPARVPVIALDRIWVRGQAAWSEPRALRSRLHRAASDHLPVCADVQWSAGTGD